MFVFLSPGILKAQIGFWGGGPYKGAEDLTWVGQVQGKYPTHRATELAFQTGFFLVNDQIYF